MNGFLIKICGLSTPGTLEAAIGAGADMIGLVFHPKSPRNVPLDVAADLRARVQGRTKTVALVVDADDQRLDAIAAAAKPDLFQLHGSETPDRVAEIRTRFGLPVMKAIGVRDRHDLRALARWARVANHILLDAKPPVDAAYPGGHGRTFDWTILDTLDPAIAFMLSGGLTPDNVGEAIRIARPFGVDVSSGVESAPGVKDIRRIEAFVAKAREAASAQTTAAGAARKEVP